MVDEVEPHTEIPLIYGPLFFIYKFVRYSITPLLLSNAQFLNHFIKLVTGLPRINGSMTLQERKVDNADHQTTACQYSIQKWTISVA